AKRFIGGASNVGLAPTDLCPSLPSSLALFTWLRTPSGCVWISRTSPRSNQTRHYGEGAPMGMNIRASAAAIVVLLAITPTRLAAQATTSRGVLITVGDNEIGGVVRGPHAPEAGVWVIAETTDLPTKFAKIVVTDEQGHYLLPELPRANYQVWVRG